MPYRYLTNLADVLRAAGLDVVEIDGWKTRGRPASTGGFNPVGVLWHHTGSYDSMADARNDHEYAEWLASVGRSDLPAPLCQLSISAEGVVYVTAAGRANHAGDARSSGTVAAGDGNSLYIGVECMNSGKQGWPKPQYDAMVKTGVALAEMLGTSAQAQRAHRETSLTGKWDPGMLDMDRFRADIAAGIKARQAPKPKPKPIKHKTRPLRVVTYNLGDGPDRAKSEDLHRLATVADVIALQEVGDRAALLSELEDFTVLREDGEGRGKVALLVRSELPIRETGWWPCTPRTAVGSLGAGPSEIAPKGIRWAKFAFAGRAVNVGVTHMVPSVQRLPFAGRTKRRSLYADHVGAVLKWIVDREDDGVTILAGDFNASPDFALLKPMHDRLACSSAPSHGKRAIDLLFHRAQPKASVVSVRALDGYSSDHKPVLVAYAITIKESA